MKSRFKKFIKNAQKITLTEEEKFNAKKILELHMENHPVINGEEVRLGYARSKIKPILTFKLMPLILALLFALSGGTALAADNTLPGDFLYPIKVGVNEQVREMLTLRQEAKAEYRSDLAARRIEEMQRLIAEGNVDETLIDELEERFEQHTEKALDLVDKLEAKGRFEAAAQVSSRLEAALEAHGDLMARISGDDETAHLALEGIRERVNNRLKSIAEIREQAEKHIGAEDDDNSDDEEDSNESAWLENAAEIKKQQSEEGIDDAKKLLAENESVLDNELEDEIESRIEAAEDAHADGLEALADGDAPTAFRYFQASLRFTHQVQVMIKSWVSFNGHWMNTDDEDADDEDVDGENDDSDDSDIIPIFSGADEARGWYWGDLNQKKTGMPDSWLHSGEGTRSAQWYDPDNSKGKGNGN